MILTIALGIFILLELANVVTLYFKPDFPYSNSMVVFKAWGRSQVDESLRLFISYLVRWVANCKVIFMTILVLIAAVGTTELKFWAVIVTMVSIGLYYVTLAPLMRRLDAMGEISPAGYTKTLDVTIGALMLMFAITLVVHVLTQGL